MRPYVVAFATATVDGCIASRAGYSKLSCPYDLERLHRLRSTADAVMVGANTAISDDPQLTVRLVPGRSPLKVIVDGRLRVPLSLTMFKKPGAGVVILTTEAAERERLKALSKVRGVRVVVAGRGPLVDFSEAFRALWDMGVRRVLVEGGGVLIGSLLRSGYVDVLKVTFSPYVFGGGCTRLVSGVGFDDTSSSPKLRLRSVSVCECGHEVHVEYEVVEPRVPLA